MNWSFLLKECLTSGRMMNAKLLAWVYNIVSVLFFLRDDVNWVEITILNNAVDKGAVCLDGSPPAYHLSPGFGAGANNWLVHLQGGGWCNNVTTCLERSRDAYGSSKHMLTLFPFSGILSDKQKFNPDFYNWNKVVVRYCDGASFTGDVDLVDADTNLHYRGARIWAAVLAELRAKGMNHASKNALLSGCSAGGLATMLHCDSFRRNFRSFLPFGTNVKCLSDAGFFINVKDIIETEYIKGFYNDVVTTHHSVGSLPHACLSRLPPGMCFFPQYMAHHIRTPLFILNAAYDSWQIQNILVPDIADPSGAWNGCKHDIKNCSSSQLQTMQGFRLNFLRALMELGRSSSRGLFINSCYVHGQIETQDTWLSSNSPVLDKTPIAKAVGDWYFNRKRFQKIDCAYPCDSTCINRSD